MDKTTLLHRKAFYSKVCSILSSQYSHTQMHLILGLPTTNILRSGIYKCSAVFHYLMVVVMPCDNLKGIKSHCLTCLCRNTWRGLSNRRAGNTQSWTLYHLIYIYQKIQLGILYLGIYLSRSVPVSVSSFLL